jgi:excisionase family DNA binding protein
VSVTVHSVSDELLSPDDLAALLKVPVKTVYNWRSEGKGPKGIKVGKYVRFRRSDVEAWLDRLSDAA